MPTPPPVTLVSLVPRLDDYFGVWAIEDMTSAALIGLFNNMDLSAHVAANQERLATFAKTSAVQDRPRQVNNFNVGRIDLVGTLMKAESSMTASTSTVQSRQVLRQMANDPKVDAILLFCDSPGGTVAGTHELAQEVVRAREKKPVGAYIEDIGASALYWIASQCDFIGMNKAGLTGSVGTLLVVYDFSGMAEKDGVKVHVLKRGRYKAIGVKGTEITEEQLTHLDGVVGSFDTLFKQEVAKGRKTNLETINSWEAAIMNSSEALSKGLVDFVGTYEEALLKLVGSIKSKPSIHRSASAMKNFDDVATIADLKEVCKGATSDFLVEQVEKGATIGDAMQAWMGKQQLAVEKANADSATLAAAAKVTPPVTLPGVKPGAVKETEKNGEEVEGDFDSLVRTEMTKNGGNRKLAILRVAKKNPDEHKAYLQSRPANKRTAIQAKIGDRFEYAAEILHAR